MSAAIKRAAAQAAEQRPGTAEGRPFSFMQSHTAVNMPTYPHAWTVEVARNAQGRAWYFVSRFIKRTEVEYVLEGFSSDPARFRRRRDADEMVAKLNKSGSAS